MQYRHPCTWQIQGPFRGILGGIESSGGIRAANPGLGELEREQSESLSESAEEVPSVVKLES